MKSTQDRENCPDLKAENSWKCMLLTVYIKQGKKLRILFPTLSDQTNTIKDFQHEGVEEGQPIKLEIFQRKMQDPFKVKFLPISDSTLALLE